MKECCKETGKDASIKAIELVIKNVKDWKDQSKESLLDVLEYSLRCVKEKNIIQ